MSCVLASIDGLGISPVQRSGSWWDHGSLRFSIVTGSESTMSGRRGVGRTLDRFLQSGGRQLEAAIARIGETLGFGPHALVVRLLGKVCIL